VINLKTVYRNHIWSPPRGGGCLLFICYLLFPSVTVFHIYIRQVPKKKTHLRSTRQLMTADFSSTNIYSPSNLSSSSLTESFSDILPPSIIQLPQSSVSMNQGNGGLGNSAVTLPIPGTKLAPEKFRRDFHKVRGFIQHYKRLCVQHNVMVDMEKCENLLRYCSRREMQTIKNFPSYRNRDWWSL